MQESRKAAEQARELRQGSAADTAQTIWDGATEADSEHAYLKAKEIEPHGVRVTGDGRLIIPMYIGSDIASLQFIDANGGKKFLGSGAVAGAYYIVGDPSHGTIVVCEGYADACSIHQETGYPALCSFSAGNMPAAAVYAKTLNASLVIFADNDDSGTGEKFGKLAAQGTSARFLMPPIDGMDASDYHLAGHDLSALIFPPQDDYLIAADDFCSQPKPIRWLIKKVVQREALMMIHGPSGGGKSFLIIDQMCHVAAGKADWCGHKIHPGPVVYLAGEGHHGMRARIAAWKRHNKADKLDMWISKSGSDLNTMEGYRRVAAAIQALPNKPASIVVDTLHRFLSGDENSAQDAKTMIDACGNLMHEFECSVILIHHTGVSDEAQHRARGSSAWKGALDLEFSVVPGSESSPIEFVQRKAKDSEIIAPMMFELEQHQLPWIDEDGDPVTSAVLIQAEKSEKIVVDKKAHEDRRILEKAWWWSGAEVENGAPYVSRAALKRYLLHETGCKESYANQQVKTSAGKLASRLIKSAYAEEIDGGFSIIDPIDSGTLLLKKGA
jgi:RecA-family ATPase